MQAATFIRRLSRDERGATLVEYGLIVAVIAVGLLVAVQGIGTSTSANIEAASTGFEAAGQVSNSSTNSR
jgi:pilus assembly protein Flp/PilA